MADQVITLGASVPDCAATKVSDILKLPTWLHNNNIPTNKPTSPTRVTTNAFLAASLAAGLSNQNPISKYEQAPTNSHAI